MFRFEELEIWRLAMEYADNIYDLTMKFPKEEKYNLVDQLRRAALSVPNNIAEGSGTGTLRSFKSFLDISISSIYETVNLLHFAKRRGYISDQERVRFYKKAETLVKKIRTFKNKLK